MKKSILIGISIITVAGIILAAVALGFGDTRTKINASDKANEPFTKEAEVLAETEISHIDIKGEIQYAQSNVSFRIIEPMYIPAGYNFESVEGKKFRGAATDLDLASFSYKNGDEFFAKNEILNLRESLTIKEDTTFPESTSNIKWKYVDINGVQGHFLEEPDGVKSLNWEIGNLSLAISSQSYNESDFKGTSLSMEEIIKMARSIK